MKVFKFHSGGYEYAIAAKDSSLAQSKFYEEVYETDFEFSEIHESKWDEKNIKMYEDNNMDLEPYHVSIRELIVGDEPQLIYTNDISIIH